MGHCGRNKIWEYCIYLGAFSLPYTCVLHVKQNHYYIISIRASYRICAHHWAQNTWGIYSPTWCISRSCNIWLMHLNPWPPHKGTLVPVIQCASITMYNYRFTQGLSGFQVLNPHPITIRNLHDMCNVHRSIRSRACLILQIESRSTTMTYVILAWF